MNLHTLYQDFGQSIWLDDIRRHRLLSGEFARMVEDDGVRGVTSNPSIFEKAIAGSTDYDAALEQFEQRKDQTASALYQRLAVEDIQRAADILGPLYLQSGRLDGFVSMEVSPYLAHDTRATLDEARRLRKTVDRQNLMIKVPATQEGIVAFRALISSGINVNVTLLFSRAVCRQVAEAYMDGLEAFLASGGTVKNLSSVASIFVSRLDVLVTPLLEGTSQSAVRRALVGKVAIANAKLAYQDWRELQRTARWRALEARGAQAQRLLWASTSTKDPRFSDVMYVEALVGRDTVNTVPPATLDAFRDHGTAGNALEANLDEARETLSALALTGISIDELTAQLLDEGVKAFSASFDALLKSVETKRDGVLKTAIDRMSSRLPAPLEAAVKATLEEWRTSGKVRRLWARDASLWTSGDENRWLSWLHVAQTARDDARALMAFASDVQRRFTQVLVLGMGGSSLCADVLSRTFGRLDGFPFLRVLDSTDPAQIRTMERGLDLSKTLFIVSSKSGATLEPNILKDYFFDLVCQLLGESEAARHFAVITDRGSPLEVAAEHGHFRRFFGVPGIGGRYSALSNFGLVPAATMGIDVSAFLERATIMAHACASCVPPEQNPGVRLGVILGTLAKGGRDKVTIVTSPQVERLGAWLEQLLAESTGKDGKGIIPVDREPLGPAEVYGDDRLFIYLRLDAGFDAATDASIEALEQAGQPVVRIALRDPLELGQEFFRWEIATAVAGALIGINPFNQPDVEASKVETQKLTDAYDRTGTIPQEVPFCTAVPLALYADERSMLALEQVVASTKTLQDYLRAHLARLGVGDYFALLAYLERNDANDRELQSIRHAVRDARRVATCVGFGPRYLHSTGQAYKGGPNSGVFLQLTCDDSVDLPVPGHRFSFGVVKAAQARGDYRVLAQRQRRVLRVHLGIDVLGGLQSLSRVISSVLA